MGLVVDSYRFATGGAWEPTDISGCIAWWDASDTASITESGGAVSQWSDKSGAGRHATQSTAGLKPTTGAATQNSLNVLTFSGDRLNFTAITSDDVARTFFVVAKKNAVSNASAMLASTGNANVYTAFDASSVSGSIVTTRQGGATATTGSHLTATYGIIRWTDTGGTTSALQIALNGTNGSTAAGGATSASWDVIGEYPSNTSFSLAGAIAEIIVYDTVLSSGDLTTVNDYLNDKWAVY